MRAIALQWMRGRAEELRAAAASAEDAYREADNREVMAAVARAYRRAAVVLDDAADELEG